MPILRAENIRKSYRIGSSTIEILRGVDFEIRERESVGIMGPSGSGKSTLLQILGAMSRPDEGRLMIGGRDVTTLQDGDLSCLRRRELGFVFQKFNLLATLNALENVAWPLLIDGQPHTPSFARAKFLLEMVGLENRLTHFPTQLSGGEQQRVAIARALVAKPKIILADEPTGALDSANGAAILGLLRQLIHAEGVALVMVTHDATAASICNRIVGLKDGLPC
jgi:putative ABC transport system ATP-binding protein